MRDGIRIIVQEDDPTCTGAGQQCPPPTVKIEKNNGGLRLFGVLVGNNCKISLLSFGGLFVFIGIVLTIVAFTNPGKDEKRSELEVREETAKNVRVLGPVCVIVGISMIGFAGFLKYLSKKAKERQTRIGFYCPVHGDFYPLSPGINPRKYSFADINQKPNCWSFNCLKKIERADSAAPDIPTCPHSVSPSNRSSFDAEHFRVGSLNPSSVMIAAAVNSSWMSSNNVSYNSMRSLSVPNDVASFPSYRSRSNPSTSPASPMHSAASIVKRLSCPVLPEIGVISASQMEKLTKPAQILSTARTELKIVQPATSIERSPCFSHSSLSSDDEMKKKKSVSIILPPEEYHTRIIHQ